MHASLSNRRATALSLLLVSACSSGGGSGGSGAAPLTLGTVTSSAQPCTGGLGNLPGTTCQRLVVEGLGNVPIEVELRVTDPQGPPIGTVLMGSGGDGTTFYASIPGAETLLGDLVTAGFRVVDRRWLTGWFTTGEGFLQQSGRYATLATWVHDNLQVGAAFCASGNSAGAAEIAYALTAWERGSILDAAILSSGPPLTRLDYVCGNPAPPEWFGLCPSIVPAGMLDCGVSDCVLGNEVVICPFLPQNPAAGELEAESILAPGAALSFPDTFVFVLLGADDCTISVPLGLLFVQAVTSQILVQYVTGAPHQMPTTASGRDAIRVALIAAAQSVPSAATAAPGPPPVAQRTESDDPSWLTRTTERVALGPARRSDSAQPPQPSRRRAPRVRAGRATEREGPARLVSDPFGRLYWFEMLTTSVDDEDEGERLEETTWTLRDARTARVVQTGVVRSSRPKREPRLVEERAGSR